MADERDSPRRFPLPWTVHGNESCYWVQDAEGKRFGYCYFDEREFGIGTASANKLTRAEALKIARNIAKLPGLLKGRQGTSKGV
jgi:hypothetical protein